MWCQMLASLVALAFTVDCACPVGHEPLNKTMWRLTMSGPMTWSEVDLACNREFPSGFQMLERDFLLLSVANKELCRGQKVPLRLLNFGSEPVVWPWSIYFGYKEEVNSTYLAHMRADNTPTGTEATQVGSLDLSTGKWSLENYNTTFSCAICQRGWVYELERLAMSPPSRPDHLDHVFTFRLVETGKNIVGVNEALRLAEARLNMTLDSEGEVIQAKIARDHGDQNESLFRLKTSWRRINPDDILGVLQGSYRVESWHDMDWCSTTMFEGHHWEKTESGEVRQVLLKDSQVATRWCLWRMYPDGDWDGVWDEIVVWIDRKSECQTNGVSNLVSRLEAYADQAGSEDMDLKSLVEITADANNLELPTRDWQPLIANVSHAIESILSTLLVSTATNLSSSSACQGHACVFLTADFQQSDVLATLLISREDDPPRLLHLNKSSAANQTTYLSLQLPQALTSVGRVALHVWRDFTPINGKPLIVQAATSRPLNKADSARIYPAMTFYAYHPGGEAIEQYLSVFSLGEGEKSTMPCPLVRSEGSVETHSCNKWKRGSRNATAMTFIAFSRWWSEYFHYVLCVKCVLLSYTTIPLDKSALLKVATFTNLFVDQLDRTVDDLSPWQEILSGVVLTEPVFTVTFDHLKILVSNLTANDPVIGFSLNSLDGPGSVQTITASSKNDIFANSAVDLVFGGHAKEHYQQLAILAVSGVEYFELKGSLEAYIKRKLMVIHLVATPSTATAASSGDVQLEIQLLGESGDEKKLGAKIRFQVATWSEPDSDWIVSNCVKRRSTRASKPVIRCESLTFANGVIRGRFLVFEPVGFAEALGTTWLVVLIAAGILCGVSLLSIAGTAAYLPAWRKDLGHKILLHMVLALSLNIALGFTSSFVSVDTTSVGCVAVGALRHFSYLAMFTWMLVMSGLQLRRLFSILGTRTTPKLLLKVSFFAWGVPTFAVFLLLIFNLDMYQSDAADRGYCYPEGTAFAWSVQVPAATVLTLNAIIFVVILARLYGFLSWGEMENLQRHLNERALQMRRLRAVFFTVCLFGITWLFHLLAEQGVFKAKFIYEYLFLMTASAHVFSLSCIFVFFDQGARAEWVKVVYPVRVKLGTWVVSLGNRWGAWIVSLGEKLRA